MHTQPTPVAPVFTLEHRQQQCRILDVARDRAGRVGPSGRTPNVLIRPMVVLSPVTPFYAVGCARTRPCRSRSPKVPSAPRPRPGVGRRAPRRAVRARCGGPGGIRSVGRCTRQPGRGDRRCGIAHTVCRSRRETHHVGRSVCGAVLRHDPCADTPIQTTRARR